MALSDFLFTTTIAQMSLYLRSSHAGEDKNLDICEATLLKKPESLNAHIDHSLVANQSPRGVYVGELTFFFKPLCF